MNTYKISWKEYMNSVKTGSNLIKADSEEKAKVIFEKEYPINVITSVINTSTKEYQKAYDSEQFDSNGKRKF